MAAQLTCTNRWPARGLFRWIVRATSSLPTPLSPSSITVALVGAARFTASSTARSAGLSPTISYLDSIASFSSRFSCRSSCCFSTFCSVTMTRSLLSGLSRKSIAPDLMASTAVLVVPWPEIITTGSVSSSARSLRSTSIPSMPGILMSSSTRSGRSRWTSASASWPEDAPTNAYSSYSRIIRSDSRIAASSSMTRMRCFNVRRS